MMEIQGGSGRRFKRILVLGSRNTRGGHAVLLESEFATLLSECTGVATEDSEAWRQEVR